MNGLKQRLEAALSPGRVVDASSELSSLRRDICRFELGQPILSVHPESALEVGEILRLASTTQTPIVPYGKRSAYWRPLSFKGAIALSLDGLTGVQGWENERVWFGAGTPVRQVHGRLLERDAVLGCHPDAYGDTSIGAMVATGFESGCGMGAFELSDVVAAIRVMGIDGREYETGVRGPLEHTSVAEFFATSGRLGVVTSVAVRPHKRPARAQIRFFTAASPDVVAALIDLSQAFGERGFYETFRAVQGEDGSGRHGFDVDLIIRAPNGPEERHERLELALKHITDCFADVDTEVSLEDAHGPEQLQRWWGPGEEHWEGAGHQWYSAVDFNVAPNDALPCLPVVMDGWNAAGEAGAVSRRLGIYMAPGLINIGLHVMYPRGNKERFDNTHPVAYSLMEALAAFPIRPYGSRGGAWPPNTETARGPSSEFTRLKALLNPADLLHPRGGV